MDRSKNKNEKTTRDVPVDPMNMDKPVYEVPLMTTMSLNFVFSKQSCTTPTEETVTQLTLPMHRQESFGQETIIQDVTNGQAPLDASPIKTLLESKKGLPSVEAHNFEKDAFKKIENKNVKENYLQRKDLKGMHETNMLNVSEGLNARRSGKKYITTLNDQNNVNKHAEDADSDGELDVEGLADKSRNHKSTFNHMTWRLPSPQKLFINPSSVVLYCDSDIVVMIKMTCVNEKTPKSARLHALMLDVAENCSRRLKKMRDLSLPKLCPKHMDSLPLNDQRPTKDHLASVSKELGDDINLSDICYRYQAENIYIGTFVSNKVKTAGHCCIGDTGVVAVLSRKSKFATIDAFSEQLCRHIAATKPASLGYVSEADVRKINKRGTLKIVHLQKDQLMLQNFHFDPTIIVAEAARKSFVKVEDFILLN